MSGVALRRKKLNSALLSCGLALGLCVSGASAAHAGGRLLATGGATQIEGSAGGGIVPWALISGYGTEDEIGGSAFLTNVRVPNYDLVSTGAAIGLYDRVELSYARQRLSLDNTVLSGLGLNISPAIRQDVFGAKVKLFGDAIYAQDSLLPQVAFGIQYKRNLDYSFIPKVLGARHDSGTDFYLAATKVFLGGLAGRNVLLNGTVRMTKANQMGLLGFGGPGNDSYKARFEGSVGVFLDPANTWLVGAEYRQNPDNGLGAPLGVHTKQDAYKDAYIAYIPNKRFALVAAYADLGALPDTTRPDANSTSKRGVYVSGQFSF
ncbi:hypothetical protein TPL01_06180 [Sulfuriferula plumbiphila]|uniref:DUF3034 domain-containing protein n=1 Tax=Sulfuriferula plumbiphila TaxID=171865 RepID=A0A512L4V6_9PROT|nr:DUF3034 family protein [Sulfuriferula plumbiphila]BBP03193.1 hypothetical protein SFPGR_06150 [Sulfuriferula plumbiphila]GEP29480.1 hypothetical protein TPL01_06180 [Sulfuriferula plumbiphila]